MSNGKKSHTQTLAQTLWHLIMEIQDRESTFEGEAGHIGPDLSGVSLFMAVKVGHWERKKKDDPSLRKPGRTSNCGSLDKGS